MTRELFFVGLFIVCASLPQVLSADMPLMAGVWSETRIAGKSRPVTTKECETADDLAKLNSMLEGKPTSGPSGSSCHIVDYVADGAKVSFQLVCERPKGKGKPSVVTSKVTGIIHASDYSVLIGKVRVIGHRLGECGRGVSHARAPSP